MSQKTAEQEATRLITLPATGLWSKPWKKSKKSAQEDAWRGSGRRDARRGCAGRAPP